MSKASTLHLRFLEHGEHAPCHEEAAKDVDGGHKDPQSTQQRNERACRSDLDQRAQNDDRRDRVGHRHQRRMQGRGHRPDDVVADEDREAQGPQMQFDIAHLKADGTFVEEGEVFERSLIYSKMLVFKYFKPKIYKQGHAVRRSIAIERERQDRQTNKQTAQQKHKKYI